MPPLYDGPVIARRPVRSICDDWQVTTLLINLGLVAIGVVAITAGVLTYRNAERITQDARRMLSDMFESSMPQLFQQPTGSHGARGTGIGFGIAGAILIVAAAVATATGVNWA